MNDQVVMSKTNAQLAVAIPLYRRIEETSLGKLEGYSLSVTNADEPPAFAIDCGDEVGIHLMSAAFVEKHLEFLGDL